MITIRGKVFNTIVDAAKEFRVSAKTVGSWIEKGIISKPPEVEYGVRFIQHFPADYIAKAKEEIRRQRDSKNHKRKAKRSSIREGKLKAEKQREK